MEKSPEMDRIRTTIESAWNDRSLLSSGDTRNAINAVIEYLDKGTIRLPNLPERIGS